jgi:hypothetical protein
MTEEEARQETKKLFGEDSFTEIDEPSQGQPARYYVGRLPTHPGPYTGYMGHSWEQALTYAKEREKIL